MRVRKMNQVDVKLHDLTKVKLKTAGNMHIPQELRIRSRGTERHSASD